ncbi:MAG: DUF21 domain-containing protein [Planctomycetales bacterium]|nr:DUF21 domain-containing protein [Planctomycetales bacterium]
MLVDILLQISPWLFAMLALAAGSAFYSGAEAAMFFLRPGDVRQMLSGGKSQQLAATLLSDPDRLLTAVLFWNLVINVLYFSIASMVSVRLSQHPDVGPTGTALFSLAALLSLIFLSEMLPKSIAVLSPRRIAGLVAIPLAISVRLVGPVLPLLRTINLLSRRLIWPGFEKEPYLEVGDLERAIELSTSDAELLEQEQRVLQNIVQLSETRVDELMRPRMQTVTFRAPVSVADLKRQYPPSGYLLVTEADSDEVAQAALLADMSDVPQTHLEHKAEPVLYVPWCSTAASALDEMESRDREVAAVVNEHGETIGILTYDDILDTIFSARPSTSERLLNRRAIQQMHDDVWHVTSLTSLRRLSKHFAVDLPETKSATIAGVLQEVLQRLPEAGDECRWGPFRMRVVDAPRRGRMLVELERVDSQEPSA